MTTVDPNERDALLARIDALERAQREHHKAPQFWKNTALLGLIGTLAAVVPTSLTAIHGYYETEREVQLAVAKYKEERTLSYLDLALDPGTSEAKQAQVFRFLEQLNGTEDEAVRNWATAELAIVQQNIEQLRKQIEDNEAKLAQLEERKQATIEQTVAVLDAPAPSDDQEEVAQAVQQEVADVERKISKLDERNHALKERIGDVAPKSEPTVVADVVSLSALGLGGGGDVSGGSKVARASTFRPWRVVIGTKSKLEAAKEIASKAKPKAGGKSIVIYRVDGVFAVTVGPYSRSGDATEIANSGVFGPGAQAQYMKTWCGEQERADGYIECVRDGS